MPPIVVSGGQVNHELCAPAARSSFRWASQPRTLRTCRQEWSPVVKSTTNTAHLPAGVVPGGQVNHEHCASAGRSGPRSSSQLRTLRTCRQEWSPVVKSTTNTAHQPPRVVPGRQVNHEYCAPAGRSGSRSSSQPRTLRICYKEWLPVVKSTMNTSNQPPKLVFLVRKEIIYK